MKHHIEKPQVEIPETELAEIQQAVERLHESRDRACFEAGARAFGARNQLEVERAYKVWKESNIPEDVA